MRMSARTARLACLSLVVTGVAASAMVGGWHGLQRLFASGPALAQAGPSTSGAAASAPAQGLATNVCAGCHSPANGPALSGRLTGRWLSPNITPDPVSGIGAWSREDLRRYLRNGKAPGRGQAGGPMASVVEALQDTSEADLDGLIDWLLRQPAHRDPADQVPASERGESLTVDPASVRRAGTETPDALQRGAVLYNTACASCHGADGSGSPGGHYPSMFHNSSVGRRTPYNLVASLLEGVERHVRSGAVFMQSFDGRREVSGGLSDDELAALADYVVKQFGNPSTAPITKEWIARSRLAWWDQGDPTAARGQQIVVGGGPGGARTACFNCHGLQGEGDAGSGSPRLAGLDVTYFAKQMRDYASGARPNGAMGPIAQQLSEADHHALALYYTTLEPQPATPVAPADRSLLQTGETLYLRGAPDRGIQACAACHGAAGRGFNPVYPSVLQPVVYTAGQLRLWRDGTRRNDPHDLMGAASRSLTDEDIRAVSAYAAGLTP
jgi:cytochrome c553